MNDWQTVWLGTMAIALAIMALIQIGLIVAVIMVAKSAIRAVGDVRKEIRPLMDKVNRMADDAAQATALARMQVERVDQLVRQTADRIDGVSNAIQNTIVAPLRNGAAVIAGIRAAISVFGRRRGDRGGRTVREDEDALFIG